MRFTLLFAPFFAYTFLLSLFFVAILLPRLWPIIGIVVCHVSVLLSAPQSSYLSLLFMGSHFRTFNACLDCGRNTNDLIVN